MHGAPVTRGLARLGGVEILGLPRLDALGRPVALTN